jgi:anti-sigma factor RsiW
MNQKHVLDLIHDYIDGLLNDVQKNSVEEHLGQCDSCRREFDSLRTLVEELHSLPKSVEPPAELFKEIESKLAEKNWNLLNLITVGMERSRRRY